MKALMSLGCILFFVSFASSSNELVSNLQKCKQVENALERLVCFDKVSKNLPEKTDTQKVASVINPVKNTNKQSLPVDPVDNEFGVEHKVNTSDLPESIYAVITSVRLGPYEKYTIQLDNGHIWKQTDARRLRLAVGENIIIKRGALNSFFLEKDGVNTRMRVKRAN